MDKAAAQSLMTAIESLNCSLGETSSAIELIADIEERKSFRRSIAEMMGDVDGKLMRPILRQYPDLDPDK